MATNKEVLLSLSNFSQDKTGRRKRSSEIEGVGFCHCDFAKEHDGNRCTGARRKSRSSSQNKTEMLQSSAISLSALDFRVCLF